MKKGLKITLIVLGILVGIVALDTLQAKVFDNSPLIKIRKDFKDGYVQYIDKGILVNHYYCGNKEEKTTWKSTKYSCPIEEGNTEITSDGSIALSIKEDTLTNTGVTLLLKNNTDKTYSYGNPFWIEKEQDGKWYKLEAKEGTAFTLPAYGIKSGEVKKWNLDWENMYGKLASGTYRIIKNVDYKKEDGSLESFNFAVEFNIDSD